MRTTLPALFAALCLAGCSATMPTFPVVPPLPAEQIPLPPVSEAPLMWQPGDWQYAGGSYRYQPGSYVSPAGHSRDWVFAHWAGARPDYVFVPGGWAR